MKLLIAKITAVLAILVMVASCSKITPAGGVAKTVADGRTLDVGFIPYDDIIDRDSNGKVRGVMADVLEAALAAKGYDVSKIVYHETSWDAFWVGLDAGKYSLCIAGTFRTPQRETRVDFTTELFSLGNGALVRADDQRFAAIASINDFDKDGLTVAVVLGEFGHEYATKNFKAAKIQSLPGPDLTLAPLEVKLGRADVAMSDQYVLRKFANQNPGTRDALAEHPYNVLPICWSVKKGNKQDVDFWNQSLASLRSSGKLAEIFKKYENAVPFILK